MFFFGIQLNKTTHVQVYKYSEIESHPRPRVTKLGPDDSLDWIIVSKPILTTAVNDTAFNTFQNIPGKQHTGFTALVKNSSLSG